MLSSCFVVELKWGFPMFNISDYNVCCDELSSLNSFASKFSTEKNPIKIIMWS
jgi:hypothetical protein